MAEPIYYLKETDILYRRKDGDPNELPDEVLWDSGWNDLIGPLTISPDAYPKPIRRGRVGGGADPLLWTKIAVITIDEAKQVAIERDLPTEGW